MGLFDIFLANTGHECHKWEHYFPIYEQHLGRFRNQSILLFEIGVFHGGSLPIWKKWLGPLATIVGIDVNPECKAYESQDGHIRIGNQADHDFLKKVLVEFGTPDIVIDDGSHKQADMTASFCFLYPFLNNNGVYLIEDMHACYWKEYGGGLKSPDSFMEKCKELIDALHGWYYMEEKKLPYITKNTWSISFYDSVTVIEKKRRTKPRPIVSPKPDDAQLDK